MPKLLLLVVIGFVIYWLVRGLGAKRRPTGTKKAVGAEDMVRCSYCGVHLPKGESIYSKTRYFCSDEHRLLESEKTP